ncbi:MAG: BlaI/MecI/CopY family transcriptional regulator [Acidobacteriaceae bacterium]
MAQPRRPKQTLTPLELKIMQVLWAIGPSKVAEVQSALKPDLAYTTVQTMLNVLLRKGQVKRTQEGKAFRYCAVVSRQRATGGAVEDLIRRMFGGSAEALLMTMVDARQIGASDLRRLAKTVAEAERREREEKP